jgi:hypothetical protein
MQQQQLLLRAGTALAAAAKAHCYAPGTNPLSGSSIFGSRVAAAAIAEGVAGQQAPPRGFLCLAFQQQPAVLVVLN